MIDSFQYEFVLRDHLGNSRVYFSDLNKDYGISIPGVQEVLQERHYYPFGLQVEGPFLTQVGPTNRYQYNGKEWNPEGDLRWFDYGWRWYDPVIGRWWVQDPMAEVAPDWTLYRYGFDNPFTYLDPNGMFESKDAAKAYAKANGIKTGLFSRNKIRKQKDGTYGIENSKESTVISDFGEELGGVMTASIVRANDVMESRVYGGGGIFSLSNDLGIQHTLRDGSVIDRPAQTGDPMYLIGGVGGIKNAVSAGRVYQANRSLKSILPAWKKIKIDIGYIVSDHMKGGTRGAKSGMKDIFPEAMNAKAIERAVKAAYKNVSKKIKSQGDRVLVRGKSDDGLLIEMWVNKRTKTIETAYPVYH